MPGGSVNIDTELYGSVFEHPICQENTFTVASCDMSTAGVEAAGAELSSASS